MVVAAKKEPLFRMNIRLALFANLQFARKILLVGLLINSPISKTKTFQKPPAGRDSSLTLLPTTEKNGGH
jgi:hypothetical protein